MHNQTFLKLQALDVCLGNFHISQMLKLEDTQPEEDTKIAKDSFHRFQINVP